jgi:hypothetical protein
MTGPDERVVRIAAKTMAALWATTGASMLAVMTIEPLNQAADAWLRRLGLDLQPSAPTTHALLVSRFFGNVRIASLPLLLMFVGAGRRPGPRAIGDAVVTGTLSLNALLVGAALGVHGSRLLPFLPHLPFEWAAFGCSAVPWLLGRSGSATRPVDVAAASVTVVLLLAAAAVVETYLTPRP